MKNWQQHNIIVIRAKVLNLNKLNANKHIGKLKVKCFNSHTKLLIDRYAE
jgi:hypothetical protein